MIVISAISDDISSMTSRIEGVVMFTLVRFTHKILRLFLSTEELAMFASSVMAIVSMISSFPQHWKMQDLAQVSVLFRKLSVLIVAQTVIDFASEGDNLSDEVFRNQASAVIILTKLSSLLFIALAVSHFFQEQSYLERSMTLLLYMYTDATELIIRNLQLGLGSASMAVLIYVFIQKFVKGDQFGFIQYFGRAFNMISINVVLNFITESTYGTNVDLQSGLLIFFLFIVDCLSVKIPIFDESRDYALWRTAQALFEEYHKAESDPLITLIVSVCVLSMKSSIPLLQNNHSISTFVELMALVLVNMILDVVTTAVENATTLDKIVVLFLYVILIHFATTLIVKWLDHKPV